MILWTVRFLRGENLREAFLAELEKTSGRHGLPGEMASASMALQGLPGVFRPAGFEYWRRWAEWPLPTTPRGWVDRLFPVQTAVPTRDPDFFEQAAADLEASDVAVMFNAFCPCTGEEYLFLNAAAMERLGRVPGQRVGRQLSLSVTAEAIKAALHLYAYGHEVLYLGQHLVDGAYHRQFLINELCEQRAPAKPALIWAVRPQNSCWIGRMPGNYFEQRDLETEIGMNSTYFQQVSRLELINRLLAEGSLCNTRYAPIALRSIEYGGQRGYFNYFNESEATFDSAFGMSVAQLAASHCQSPPEQQRSLHESNR